MKVTRFSPNGLDAVLGGALTGSVTNSGNAEAVSGVSILGSAASNYHIVAYSSNEARWIPHDAAGVGSVSFGSNAMAVSAANNGGASTNSAREDHRHQGIETITASSSNTLQRPTVNLRAGNNVSFGLTDSDGNGALDTLTIHAAAGAAGGSSSLTVADEGTPLSTAATTLDFVGSGVTASGTGATKTITIPGGSGALTFLSETALGSAAADITVTGISGSYRDLVVVVIARSASGGTKALWMQFGAGSIDTGSNYGYYRNYVGSIGTGSDANTGDSKFIFAQLPGSGSASGAFSDTRVEILDYASSARRKSFIAQGFSAGDDGTLGGTSQGTWYSTSTMDQLKIVASSGNLETGSRVIIYGRG